MRSWWWSAATNISRRAEQPRSRFTRGIVRWSLPAPPTVPASQFQGPDEPFPRHWRHPPRPWRAADPADPAVEQALAAALSELPATWRTVLVARDIDHSSVAEVTARTGLTAVQQRAILNRSRELLRRRLADRLTGDEGP
jgi:RNA polymerase sigma-70 factor (ECF subfamily)